MPVPQITVPIGTGFQQEPTFWQGVKNTASRVWSVITDKATLLFETISGIFFSALEYISPSLANKASMAWGFLTRTWMRAEHVFSEEQLKKRIGELEAQNRTLAEQLGEKTVSAEQAQNKVLDLSPRAIDAEAAAEQAQRERNALKRELSILKTTQQQAIEQIGFLNNSVEFYKNLFIMASKNTMPVQSASGPAPASPRKSSDTPELRSVSGFAGVWQ